MGGAHLSPTPALCERINRDSFLRSWNTVLSAQLMQSVGAVFCPFDGVLGRPQCRGASSCRGPPPSPKFQTKFPPCASRDTSSKQLRSGSRVWTHACGLMVSRASLTEPLCSGSAVLLLPPLSDHILSNIVEASLGARAATGADPVPGHSRSSHHTRKRAWRVSAPAHSLTH